VAACVPFSSVFFDDYQIIVESLQDIVEN
jgi:hypothetical protein